MGEVASTEAVQLQLLLKNAKRDIVEHLKHEIRKGSHANARRDDTSAQKQAKKEELLQHWHACLDNRSKNWLQLHQEIERQDDDGDAEEHLAWALQKQAVERLQTQIIDVSHQLKLQRDRYLQSALQLCDAIQARDAGPSNPCTQEMNKWNLAIELAEGFLSKRIAQEKATFQQVSKGEEELIKTALEAQYSSLRTHCTMHISSVRDQEQRLSKYYASVLQTVHDRTMEEMQRAKSEAEQDYATTHLRQSTESYAGIYDRLCQSILSAGDNYTQARNSSDISEERLTAHDQLLHEQRIFMSKIVRTLNKIESCYTTAVMDIQEEIRNVQEHTHRSAMWLQTLNMFDGSEGVFKFWRQYGQDISGSSRAPDVTTGSPHPSSSAMSQATSSGTLAGAVSRKRMLGPTLFGARLSSLSKISGVPAEEMASAMYEVAQEAEGNQLMLKLVQTKLAVIERKAVYRRRKLRFGMLVHCICVLRRRAKAARLPQHMRVPRLSQTTQQNNCQMN